MRTLFVMGKTFSISASQLFASLVNCHNNNDCKMVRFRNKIILILQQC